MKKKLLLTDEHLAWSFYSGVCVGIGITLAAIDVFVDGSLISGEATWGIMLPLLAIQIGWAHFRRFPKQFERIEIDDE